MVIAIMSTKPVRSAGSCSRWSAFVVLTALGLRALVPAGFMIAPVDGRAEIVFCGPDAAHALHSHGGHADRNGHRAQVDPICPFAQSAAPAVASAVPVALPVLVGTAAPLRGADALPFVWSGPVRQQSPRGPPHFT